jgi:A/G-specific adenine glycosylase
MGILLQFYIYMATNLSNTFFTTTLLTWHQTLNNRTMPWKGEKNPYKIWLSEIILQQTRVEQGLAYYNKFVQQYPTIQKLAAADDTSIFKLWEGLGYYSRCKNLIATAKYVANTLNGIFPTTYEAIVALKGIGPYTAAAIASFAYNLPYAVVDGNVYRVLSRYFGIFTPIDTNEGKKEFTKLATQLLAVKQPSKYNQAIMDFGATVCKPSTPLCNTCMLANTCKAYKNEVVQMLPIKQKKPQKKVRYFYYIIAQHKGKVYVKKRPAGDIWENLYQFILIESATSIAINNQAQFMQMHHIIEPANYTIKSISSMYKQQLTHQTLFGQFIYIEVKKPLMLNDYTLVSKSSLQLLPFPKFITGYLKDKNVSLNLL